MHLLGDHGVALPLLLALDIISDALPCRVLDNLGSQLVLKTLRQYAEEEGSQSDWIISQIGSVEPEGSFSVDHMLQDVFLVRAPRILREVPQNTCLDSDLVDAAVVDIETAPELEPVQLLSSAQVELSIVQVLA